MKIDVRQNWLDYYSSLGFKIIPSAPLVHPAFSMSFNMSAGLVQLDPIIRSLTKTKPKKECLVQKCFRHFDIDKVGDTTHLTFFEMPGAFEVGEFDEERTVKYVWDFLTKTVNINPKKLWLTSFEKDTIYESEIHQDTELLSSLRMLCEDRLVLGDKTTNLWMQGGGIKFKDNTRLCGPQVEVFYDLRSDDSINPKENPLNSPEKFIEVSNTIFIKYYIDYTDFKIKSLLNPSSESVIGLERVSGIVENKEWDLFNTSSFQPLIELLPQQKIDKDIKIILNNVKSLVFILAEEEITPGRSGRNRIVRYLIRNLLSSFYLLNLSPQKYLPILIDEIILMYESVYPEVVSSKTRMLRIVLEHEKVFLKTLAKAQRLIEKYLNEHSITSVGKTESVLFQEKYGMPSRLLPKYIKSPEVQLGVGE